MTEPVIQVESVMRSYGQVVALTDVSLDIEGGIVGLLGPNGAGKSTLLHVLTGQLRPSLGKVRVLGVDPYANARFYQRVGVCPQREALFEDVSGFHFVSFMLRLRGWDAAEADRRARVWLEQLGLSDAMHRRIRGYSKGMRQRAKIAAAMGHEAELLFLDEPMTGLDPIWRHRVLSAMKEKAANGTTLLFSSHVLHEVEQATRQVVLLHRGRVLAQGDGREIRGLVDSFPHRVFIDADVPRTLGLRLLGWECVESVRVRDDGVDVTTPQPDRFYARLTTEAAREKLGVQSLHSPDDSLQALFEMLVQQ